MNGVKSELANITCIPQGSILKSEFANITCDVPQGNILKSELANITCGVPQGPLLLLLYFSNMNAAVKCILLVYADNSTLMVSGKDG